MPSLSDIIAALRLPPRILVGIALPSGFLVLSPKKWLIGFGLDGFVADFRPLIALVFLLTSSILLVELVVWAFGSVTSKVNKGKIRKKLEERIKVLDFKELCVLREFRLQGQSTVLLPLDQPVVAGLVQKGILRQVGGMGQHMACGVVFSFKINDNLVDRITDEYLELPPSDSKSELEEVMANRPSYVIAVLREDNIFHSRRY